MDTIWLIVGAGALVVFFILALVFRQRPRVIDTPDAGGPVESRSTARDAAPAKDDDPPMTAGDILKRQGADKFLEAFADWVEQTAAEQFDMVIEDMAAMTRLADAARAALPKLLAEGRAVIELPYLLADASGPKHFRHEFDLADMEEGVVSNAFVDVPELLRWRGSERGLVALGAWLQAEVEKEIRGDLDSDETAVLRVVAAARAAWADYQRAGRARIELAGLPVAGADPVDFRREIDRATMAEAERLLAEREADAED